MVNKKNKFQKDKYFIISGKRFKDWEKLEHKLDVLLHSKNPESFEIYSYGDIKRMWGMMTKYTYWNNYKLNDANNVLDDFIEDYTFIIFDDGKDGMIKRIKKQLKKERIKPILF